MAKPSGRFNGGKSDKIGLNSGNTLLTKSMLLYLLVFRDTAYILIVILISQLT
jgi:hypothetical protein